MPRSMLVFVFDEYESRFIGETRLSGLRNRETTFVPRAAAVNIREHLRVADTCVRICRGTIPRCGVIKPHLDLYTVLPRPCSAIVTVAHHSRIAVLWRAIVISFECTVREWQNIGIMSIREIIDWTVG